MDVLQDLRALGVSVRIDGGNLIANPRSLLTDEHREALRADKPALLSLPAELARAIHRCCDVRGDDDGNRAALILECMVLPAWEQRELVAHFNHEADRFAQTNAMPSSA